MRLQGGGCGFLRHEGPAHTTLGEPLLDRNRESASMVHVRSEIYVKTDTMKNIRQQRNSLIYFEFFVIFSFVFFINRKNI